MPGNLVFSQFRISNNEAAARATVTEMKCMLCQPVPLVLVSETRFSLADQDVKRQCCHTC